jgi:glucose/arabinose dehydrogenase
MRREPKIFKLLHFQIFKFTIPPIPAIPPSTRKPQFALNKTVTRPGQSDIYPAFKISQLNQNDQKLMKHFLTLSSLALLLLLTHCDGSDTENPAAPDATPNDPVRGPIIRSERQNFGIDTLASGLNNPWGLAFLPDGRILVTERSGEIRIIQNGRLTTERIQNVPAVFRVGQGGLLDIQTHPQFASNSLIYFCYSRPGSGGGATALARARLQGNSFTEVQELFVGQPFSNSAYHFGSRIAFDDQGHVFLSTGDRGTPAHSQNLGNHWGKILRLRDDGRVPADNPFVNTANARPEIWSFGHRNVQGLVFDAATRTLWAHEHGPRGGDELNRIEAGRNYGWPVMCAMHAHVL